MDIGNDKGFAQHPAHIMLPSLGDIVVRFPCLQVEIAYAVQILVERIITAAVSVADPIPERADMGIGRQIFVERGAFPPQGAFLQKKPALPRLGEIGGRLQGKAVGQAVFLFLTEVRFVQHRLLALHKRPVLFRIVHIADGHSPVAHGRKAGPAAGKIHATRLRPFHADDDAAGALRLLRLQKRKRRAAQVGQLRLRRRKMEQKEGRSRPLLLLFGKAAADRTAVAKPVRFGDEAAAKTEFL